MEGSIDKPRRHGSIWRPVTFLFLLSLIVANTFLFTSRAANPVLVSDTWGFVYRVVLPYAEGDFDVGDLFAKRNALDHSQPFRKVLLIANYEWFDLDLSVDAIIGLLFALAALAFIWYLFRSSRAEDRPPTELEYVAFLALAAAYLSLNSEVVFAWPLVTTSFTNHIFILLYAWAAWKALELPSTGRLAALFAAGFWLSLIADDTGLLVTIAVVLAVAINGMRASNARRAVVVAITAVLAHVTYALFYMIVSNTPEGGSASLPVLRLMGVLSEHGFAAWQVIEAPLAGSVAHREDLHRWMGGASGLVTSLVLLLLVAHVYFWLAVFTGRRNVASFVAVVLMLLFYGLVAGVYFARVADYSLEYLWQPRYSIFYRWNLVALLLMLLGQLPAGPLSVRPMSKRVQACAGGLLSIGLLLVQVPLSHNAWKSIPYIKKYQERQARQIIEIAGAPDRLPATCMPEMVICRFEQDARATMIWFLESQELNVFNEDIRQRHALDLE